MLRLGFRPLTVALLAVAAPSVALVPAVVHATVPGSTSAVNTDENGLAMRGYDPVAYFDTGKPTLTQQGIDVDKFIHDNHALIENLRKGKR